MSRSANASVPSIDKIANRFTCSGAGDVLDDYPDSPGTAPQLSGEAASRLLDADDIGMDTAAPGPSITKETVSTGPSLKRRLNECSTVSDGQQSTAGPTLPPIYYSVQRKRLSSAPP
jgi:hypothetical protein